MKKDKEHKLTGNGTYDDRTAYRLYLREVVRTRLLTHDEHATLTKRIKAGDKKAREQMIKANLRLVVKIAHKFVDFGLPLLDLINEGNIGLMKAVERFDPSKGRFSTHATEWIESSIKRALSNRARQIRLPVHVVDSILKMNREINTFEATHSRSPEDSELAAILGVTEGKIASLRKKDGLKPISLENPTGDDSDSVNLLGLTPDERVRSPWQDSVDDETKELIIEAISKLRANQQMVINMRFPLNGTDEPKTLEEVGKSMGFNHRRAHQIQKKALAELRKLLGDKIS